MNTLTKGFAKRVISMLLVTIMVFSLGIVGLTSASAANVELAETAANNVTGGHIYFDKPTSWGSTCVQFVIGRSGFSRTYVMSKVNNSNMYYINISSLQYHTWDDATYYAFIHTDSKWGDGDWGSSNLSNAGNRTAAYTETYDLKDGSTYVFTPASSSDGASLSIKGGLSYTTANTTNYVYAKSTTDGTNFENNATAGIVSISGYYLNGDNSVATRSAQSSTTSTYYKSTTLVQGSTATVKATPAAGYDFIGWYSAAASGGTCYSTEQTYTYTVGKSTTYMYARFKPSVSFSSATATIDPKSIVLGNSAKITVGYTCTSTATPTYTLCDGNGNPITSGYTLSGNVFTVTPTVAQNYVYKVKITVNGVSTFTDTVTLECKNEYAVSLDVDNDTKYTDDTFTFTIKDNSNLYEGVTYKVYCNDELVTPVITDKTFTASHAAAGTYTYYVVATVDGKDVNSDKVTITVKAKVFSVYLTAPKSTMEDRPFEIKAYTEFAAGTKVTYTLTGTDGTSKVLESTVTDGGFPVAFSVTVNTVGDYTFTIYANDGVNEPVTDSVKVTITEDKGTYPVKIYFKCSDTYGYLPNAKVDGTAVTLTKESSIITYNATDTATYSWYSYTVDGEVEYGTKILFAVNATRNYFYNASYTVSAGEGKFQQEGDYYCYYLALENLNGGTNILSNLSDFTEEERNWTESAVNMIYDDADAKAPVGVNFAYANMNDANTDGKINVKDATYIQKSLANIVEASALSTAVSDVNNDGKVTIKDATALQKQIAGL